jgi:menaquinone-dependent protoporphyrinogen oxidase
MVFMKSLIIYATKYGCTEKAVRLLRTKIRGEVTAVNVTKDDVPSLSPFDTVIIGGPIYAGRIHKSLSLYMHSKLDTLIQKRLALFICAGEEDHSVIEKQIAEAFPEELFRHAIAAESFGGDLYWDKLDSFTKLILRMAKGIKSGYLRLSEAKIVRFAEIVSG